MTTATRASPSVTSVRCLVTADSPVSKPVVTASPLERLRQRQMRDAAKAAARIQPAVKDTTKEAPQLPLSFQGLGLDPELMMAVKELGLAEPTEVQALGIPAVVAGESVVIASHTGSGKTLAYMLPIVQALRRDEVESGKATRPRRPRAVVLCPTRELAEQVFHVAKSICHHARFRAAMVGGGTRMKPQEDSLNTAVDLVVATPGRLLMHVEEGNMAYGDLKYVVLDEADTMFDKGFGVEVRKFLGPLRNRSKQPGGDFQTILVTATITKAVQKLLDEEFPGIKHVHTSTLHKAVSSAHHDFVRLTGTENKLEALLQVLEPSLAKGRRVMVFCNTLGSCRAVDHFLSERGTSSVNYHGAVPAEERVENLKKFKGEGGADSVPALVCTDLAARGLDLVVDHVINFDFPLNPIDYLHRTGRTARMGAKGKVTSLVTKRDQTLASQLEESMRKGETLEGLTSSRERLEALKRKEIAEKRKEKAKKMGHDSSRGPKSSRWEVGKNKVGSLRGTRGKARTASTPTTRVGSSSRVARSPSRKSVGLSLKQR